MTAALVAVLGFCAYGLVSTLEPLEGSVQWRWRIAYGGVAAAAAALIGWLWWPRAEGASAVETRPAGEGHGAPAALRAGYGAATFGLGILILFVWPFAWILRDGLGPSAVESHGLQAAIHAFWTFYTGPLTLAAAAASLGFRWRLRVHRRRVDGIGAPPG